MNATATKEPATRDREITEAEFNRLQSAGVGFVNLQHSEREEQFFLTVNPDGSPRQLLRYYKPYFG